MLETALNGLKVMDMTRILAGPWCTQNLADLGADVIKVEHPVGGDDTRSWGPPYPQGTGAEHGFSSYFAAANRGKRSLAVSFATDEGRAVLTRLAEQSDVLVENYKTGTLARYGLGYEDLKKVNPRLIYCSITGYGQSGPMAHKPGYDFVFQGTGGLMSYTGQPDGRPGAEPLRAGISLMDLSSGLYATSAILAAVIQRGHTGEGQYIDMALLDASVAMNANMAQTYLMTGVPPKRFGNAHPTIAPYEVFATSDGFMILAVGNDSQFAKFCQVAGRPDVSEDERYRTNAGRVANRDTLREIVAGLIATRTREDWGSALEAAGVPWGPINNLDDVFADEQVQHRKMLQQVVHPVTGPLAQVRNPMLYGVPIDESAAPPLNGEHTPEILADLGFSEAEIQALHEHGTVATWHKPGEPDHPGEISVV
ncbi:CaiB/BaiF CoA transferase family protein [Cumulibacter manganitolerans]|uniref:CaiB/BaiF CoA transferase family protein n=1 Tax=Cumulibacter manganitolerans TaxID=1884992 RepID=UPI00129613DA|nr:CaiB/BaiF CoA-transferase family protein [Cumulibacter manganitolerans]